MKKTFTLISNFLILSIYCFGQNDLIPAVPGLSIGAPSVKLNYTSFAPKRIPVNEKWKKRNAKYISHPDAGYIAHEQPPGNVIELFEKRTETTRFYIDADTPSKIFSQGAYGPLHYKKNGQWLIIDSRLNKNQKDIIEASHQVEPVGFDLGKKKSYIKTSNGILYFNDWKVFGKKKNETKLLASANWDDYSAGDDGVFIKNIFPGIDAEMQVLRGRIKTNLIVRQWALPEFDEYLFSDNFLAPEKGSFTFVDTDNQENGIGELDFKSNNKLLARIGQAVLYQESDAANVVYLPYSFENDQLGMTVKGNTIKELLKKGSVIIDPLVTGPQGVFTPGSVLNSYNNANCSYDFNLGCSYNWTVPIPPFIQVTNTHFTSSFLTMAPCTRDKMRFSYGFGDLNCKQKEMWSTLDLPPTPGITSGNNTTDLYNSCIESGCVQKNMKVTMSIIRGCMGPAGCGSACVQGVGPFVITIEGRTVELVTVTATPEITQCPGEAITLAATADFGIKPYTFQWNPGNLPGSDVRVNPVIKTNYTVTVKDACNQTVTGNKTVNVPPPLPAMTVSISAPTVNICEGSMAIFSAKVANVLSPVYQWKINNIDVPGANSAIFNSALIANNDVISVVVTNPATCAIPAMLTSNLIKMTVNPSSNPGLSILSDSPGNTICKGALLTFTATASNGGAAPVYQWLKNGVKVGNGSATYADAGFADKDIISCQITNNSLCAVSNIAVSNTITITVKEPVFVTINKTLCANNLPYLWNGQTINTAGNNAAVFKTASRVTGCDSTTTLNLIVLPPASVSTMDTAACGSIVFAGKTYQASTTVNDIVLNQFGCDSLIRKVNIIVHVNMPASEPIILTGCDSLEYEGIIYRSNITLQNKLLSRYGCDSINKTVQIVIEKFDMDLAASYAQELYYGDPVSFITSSNAAEYSITAWYPESLFLNQYAKTQNIRVFSPDTLFTVYGQNQAGCIDSASVNIKILPKPFGNLLPNVFTPDNDGINDVWAPLKGPEFPVGELFIYNRWGECIYHTQDYIVPWDGKQRDTKVPAGVYPYRLIISKKFEFKGSVTVLY